MYIRMLRKPPCEVSYESFTYHVVPRGEEGGTSSYIAARLVSDDGMLWEPHHEHELTRRFVQAEGAQSAWPVGFEARRELFLARSLIDRLVDEGAAEIISDDLGVAAKAQFPMQAPAATYR
jgi:hypothetical protein